MKVLPLAKNLSPANPVEIRQNPFGRGVYSLQNWESDELILVSTGRLGTKQTAHTIQVDEKLHLLAESPLLYLNHSCSPNCGLFIPAGTTEIALHARREIRAGEELTLDYESFEENMQFLNRCACGSSACRKTLRGFDNLPAKTREEYGEYIAEYLRNREIKRR